jgi:hypothetical protein
MDGSIAGEGLGDFQQNFQGLGSTEVGVNPVIHIMGHVESCMAC